MENNTSRDMVEILRNIKSKYIQSFGLYIISQITNDRQTLFKKHFLVLTSDISAKNIDILTE